MATRVGGTPARFHGSASTRTPTSIEVVPDQLTCASACTRSPTRTGSTKSISSIDAVTAGPPECRCATTPATSSTSFITTPPCTVPSRFVSRTVMIRLRVLRAALVGLPSSGGASVMRRKGTVVG